MGTIYRFFSDKKYAEDFLKGRIRLSTLEDCRKLEEDRGGDPLDGFLTTNVKNLTINWNDEHSKIILKNIPSINMETSSNIRFVDFNFNTVLNAHVLCFTKKDSGYVKSIFGKHGVVIHRPRELYSKICKIMADYDLFFKGAKAGSVVYEGHSHSVYEDNSIQKLGFTKRKSIFENEKEFRMVFFSSLPVKPEFIEVGDIRDIATLY